MKHKKAVELYLQGLSFKAVGVKLNVCGGTIKDWLIRQNIPLRDTRLSISKKREIKKLYLNGLSMNEISKVFNVHDQTIKRHLIEMNVKIRYKRPIYSEEIKQEAKRLYLDEEMSAKKVAKTLGLKDFTIKQWMKEYGVIRNMSEAASLSIVNGNCRSKTASKTWYKSEKMNKEIFAESSLEYLRMIQLDEDETVRSWDRCRLRIKYIDPKTKKIRHYNPDLIVNYKKGDVVIEEVKPRGLLTEEVNLAKFDACRKLCQYKGYSFKLITEDDVGESRSLEELHFTKEEMRLRYNERRREQYRMKKNKKSYTKNINDAPCFAKNDGALQIEFEK